MARIRTIKPDFWASEQVMECSPIARLLFIGLWNFCDDGGNHVDSDRTIKAEIFPGDDISSQDIRRLIDELSSNGLLAPYVSNGKGFLHVTGWQHQKIERPSFKHPPFPGSDSSKARRTLDDNSPPEGKGRERKGEEGKEASSLRSDSSSAAPSDPPPPADLRARQAERLAQVADEAIAAYNASPLVKPNGGVLSTVSTTVGRERRQKEVGRCLRVARQISKETYETDRVPPQFWVDYFLACSLDDFHAGRALPGRGHENWKPDFEYLTQEKTMLKVYDRAADEGAAA